MKSFDRACVYIYVCLGILIMCAVASTREAGIIAICSLVALAVLLVYENRISYYEEKAERYRKMFLAQNKHYLDTVSNEKCSIKCKTENIDISSGRKSGIDKAKAS